MGAKRCRAMALLSLITPISAVCQCTPNASGKINLTAVNRQALGL